MEIEKRLEAIERRLAILEDGHGISAALEKNVIVLDLTLPEENAAGLCFNEQKVHAVFEKHEDGKYYSRDILFLSARNSVDDNSMDLLTAYLNSTCHENGENIKDQIADALGIDDANQVKLFLPQKPEGVKQYNGVNWRYWLADKYGGSTAYFCDCNPDGLSSVSNASAVGGAAPAFCVAQPHTAIYPAPSWGR